MREIKFRYRVNHYKEPEEVFTFTGTLEDVENRKWEPNPFDLSYTTLSRDQFTGLHDKNGKEIYEGDIIRILLRRHMEDLVFANAEIHFEGAAFWFNARKIGFTDCNWHFYNQSDREVIGNIYKNPELLK